MISSLTLSRLSNGQAMSTVKGADDLRVGNVGRVSGTASFTLSETSDSAAATVFDVMQLDSNNAMNIAVAGNDNNTRFSGYNINAAFNENNSLGYNVELNTINSTFDFSGTTSGAQVSTTMYSANNRVQLGGGKNIVHAEEIDGALTSTGVAETRYFNNLVTDSGYSNVFLSSADSQTKFETTSTSAGAFIQGGFGNDVYNIGGSYGVFNGVGGDNIFTTAAAKDIDDKSAFNVIFGGIGSNAYNDFGIKNMYHGGYALFGQNGADVIRLNGFYGIAKIDTSNDTADAKSDFFINGSYNAGFTGDSATVDGLELRYEDILLGRVGEYVNSTAWSLNNFFSSANAPSGYAANYSSALLKTILQ